MTKIKNEELVRDGLDRLSRVRSDKLEYLAEPAQHGVSERCLKHDHC